MAHEAQKKYMATLKKFEIRIKHEIFEKFKLECETNESNPTAETKKFINNYIGGNEMDGYELKNKLEDLTDEEIEKGTKAWNIAEEIFQNYYSNGDGDDVVVELLSHNFIYDYKDFKSTPYLEDDPEIADFAEQGLLIKQVNDYMFWADEMKMILK